MEVLGGSFGKGKLTIDERNQSISINGKKFSFSEIISISDKNIANPSNTKSLGVATAAGYLLTGPVGGLAGLALGALSEKKGYIIFEIVIVGGSYALVRGSFDSFGIIRAAVGERSTGATITQSPAEKVEVWRSRTILGRACRCAPALAFDEIKSAHASNAKGAHVEAWSTHHEEFFKRITVYAKVLNDVKWRYFDSLLSQKEIERCAIFVLNDLQDTVKMKMRELTDFESSGGNLRSTTPKPVFPDDLRELIDEVQFQIFPSKEKKRQLEHALLEFEKFKLALAEWERVQGSEEQRLKDEEARQAAISEILAPLQEGERYVRAYLAHESYLNEVWDIWDEVNGEGDDFASAARRLGLLDCAVDVETDAAGNRLYARIDGDYALENVGDIFFQSEYNEFVLGILKRYVLMAPT